LGGAAPVQLNPPSAGPWGRGDSAMLDLQFAQFRAAGQFTGRWTASPMADLRPLGETGTHRTQARDEEQNVADG